jgi:MFS family permease
VIAVGGVGCIVGGLLAERVGRAEAAAAAMLVSGTCALVIGLLVDASTPLLLAFGLVWGFAVIADSALFSTLVTEYADQAYVGTALALQLAIGFALTAATIWLIPVLEDDFGWKWAFAFLAPGPILGVLAMVRLSTCSGGRSHERLGPPDHRLRDEPRDHDDESAGGRVDPEVVPGRDDHEEHHERIERAEHAHRAAG